MTTTTLLIYYTLACILTLFINNVSASGNILSLIWSPGFCKTNQCNPNYDHSNEFTIHGLWLGDCSYPQKRSHPNVDKLLSNRLIADLRQHWPSSFNHHEIFWNHEWQTHGTCLGTLRKSTTPIATQANEYFQLVVDIHQTLPIISWLRSNSVVPSNTISYTYRQIETAIRVHTNHGVHLLCSIYQNRAYLYQLELILKFDKDIIHHTFSEPSYRRHDICPHSDIFIAS